jgi:uncharacterized GH25 family protein
MSNIRHDTWPATVIGLATALILSPLAYAHHPWVTTEPAQTSAGQSVEILPFFGHAFPSDERSSIDRLSQISLTNPDGQLVELDRVSDATLNTGALTDEGVYVVGTRQTRGYWTRTTEGGERLPRSKVENAVRCSYSDNGSKTLVQVGNANAAASVNTPIGHRLEIVPIGNPLAQQTGETVQIKVLFEGQPHAGPLMVFHSESGEDPYLMTETDASGLASMVLEGPAPWLLLAHGEIDYPDPTVCDVESFYASLTFFTASNN